MLHKYQSAMIVNTLLYSFYPHTHTRVIHDWVNERKTYLEKFRGAFRREILDGMPPSSEKLYFKLPHDRDEEILKAGMTEWEKY